MRGKKEKKKEKTCWLFGVNKFLNILPIWKEHSRPTHTLMHSMVPRWLIIATRRHRKWNSKTENLNIYFRFELGVWRLRIFNNFTCETQSKSKWKQQINANNTEMTMNVDNRATLETFKSKLERCTMLKLIVKICRSKHRCHVILNEQLMNTKIVLRPDPIAESPDFAEPTTSVRQ